MNFFWSEEEAGKWLEASGMSADEDVYCLTLSQALDEAYATFYI